MPVLALRGGTPVRRKPFPSIGNRSGRTFDEEEMRHLQEVMASGALSRAFGTKVKQLEEEFPRRIGARYCTASTSGTAAIHIALGAINPEPGSEVITGPITDMGTIIPILFQNCIPVFADLDPETLTFDLEDLERRITERTKAIIPVHLCGNANDMDGIMALAERYGLWVIEDCSQAYGTLYKGRHVGTIGHLGCFSLQQSKHITAGEGGLTVTNDPHLAERAALFANKGWPNYGQGGRDYVMFGTNYRMTELQAAVVLGQLTKLERVTEARHRWGTWLTESIRDLPGLRPPIVRPGVRHTYWFYPLQIDQKALGVSTDRFAEALRAEGIPAGAHYIGKPIFLFDLLREKRIYGTSRYPFDLLPPEEEPRYEPGVTPKAERILADLVQIPINENYTEEDVRDIATAIRKVVENREELQEG